MKQEKLLHGSIPKLLGELAAPSIAAQLVTLLYNLVDRIYIGRMADGITAMAAIGICAPVVTIITSFSSLFGRGGSPLASIELGKKDNHRAESILAAASLC